MKQRSIIIILAIAFFQMQALAQTVELNTVRGFVETGQLNLAATRLNQLAIEYPDNMEIQLYQAHVYAWSGELEKSVAAFRAILQKNPKHMEALTGLGYALSWSNDFPNALYAFRDALRIGPDNMDARKGLAFGYLIRGNLVAAKYEFQQLVKASPNDPDFQIGLARAEYLLGNTKEAKKIIHAILEINPRHEDAKQLLTELRRTYTFLELDVWGSYSQIDTASRFGFRQFQLTYQFRPGRIVYGRIDNSLSLDNLDFLMIDQRSVAAWLGYHHSWNKYFSSRLEIGQRYNPAKSRDENLLRVEQVYSHKAGYQWKLGGYVGSEPKQSTEWLGWTSVFIPLGRGFSLEPAYFYSKDDQLSAPQQRFLLTGKWAAPNGLEINSGGFYGIQKVENSQGQSTLYGGYVLALIPVHEAVWLQMSGYYERGLFINGSIAALGLKVRL